MQVLLQRAVEVASAAPLTRRTARGVVLMLHRPLLRRPAELDSCASQAAPPGKADQTPGLPLVRNLGGGVGQRKTLNVRSGCVCKPAAAERVRQRVIPGAGSR